MEQRNLTVPVILKDPERSRKGLKNLFTRDPSTRPAFAKASAGLAQDDNKLSDCFVTNFVRSSQ
jgi:hypothetical protein